MLQKTDKEKKNINLLDCVKLFTEEEQLGEDDHWYGDVDYCVEMYSDSYDFHICTHAHECAHTHTHKNRHTHMHTHIHMYTCTHMCMYTHICMYTLICVQAYTYKHMYIPVCTHVCICTQICTSMYVHVFIHCRYVHAL